MIRTNGKKREKQPLLDLRSDSGWFFLLGLGGVAVLTAGMAALPWVADGGDWSYSTWATALACWHSLFILWIVCLIFLRSRQHPRRDWFWTLPVALFLMAVAVFI